MSKIERMVEESYQNNSKFKYDIAEQICYIKKVSSKWRKIGGDGNCFYRSVMFRYLENLIFIKDISNLKNIANKIVIWFNSSYNKTAALPFTIRKSFTDIDTKLILCIIYYICELLEKNQVKEAYSVLIKSFICAKTFDIGMVLYLRYEIFEFIEANKDCLFSKDFPVMLGNLLPSQYETDDSKFLWEEFYNKELMKLYTYAEKIVIYITPFILKRNITLVIFDYGKDCNIQTKLFSCGLNLENFDVLDILYRKCHYDVAYSKEFVEKYYDLLNVFSNNNETLKVVDQNLIDYYQKNVLPEEIILQSKIFDKKNNLHLQQANNEKKQEKQENNIKSDANEISHPIKKEIIKEENKYSNTESNVSEKEKIEKELYELKSKLNNFTKCGICNSNFKVEESIHKLHCTDCLKKVYNDHLNGKISSDDLLHFRSLGIQIQNIKSLNKYFCAHCGQKESLKFIKSFKCGCNFCSESCLNNHSNLLGKMISIKNYNKIDGTYFIKCKCMSDISISQLIEFTHKNEDLKKILKFFYSEVFFSGCMFCSSLNNGKNMKSIEVDDSFKLFETEKIIHLKCPDCIEIPFSLMECVHCNSFHK